MVQTYFDIDNPYASYQSYPDDYVFENLDEMKFRNDKAKENFPDYRYTKLSPKDKRTHLDLIGESLLEKDRKFLESLEEDSLETSGFNWQTQDDLLQNVGRSREAQKLFDESGARWVDKVGGDIDESLVNTKEKKKKLERAYAINENLAAISGMIDFKEKGWDDHWLKRSGRWADETLGDFGEWITDPHGARYDIPKIPGAIGDMEWDKILKNAAINTPEMLLDLATFAPQAGYQVGKGLTGGEPEWFLKNRPYFEYEDRNTAERVAEETLAGAGAIPLYKALYKRAKSFPLAQKFIRNWMPFMHQAYQKPPPGTNWLKNLAGVGARSVGQGLLFGAPAAGLTTLLYSPPLNAGEANMFQEPAWEPWMEHSTSRFDLDNPNEMRNFKPRVVRSQDEQRGPGPWNEFRG